jgi:hypothetical protein
MRASIALATVLLAWPAPAQDSTVVSVWEGYDFRTSDWTGCESILADYLAAADLQRPFCEYQHIDNLIRDGWVVTHSLPIEAPLRSGSTRIDGCYLFELKCVGTRYFLTRDERDRPPAPELKHIQVPQALGSGAPDRSAPPE